MVRIITIPAIFLILFGGASSRLDAQVDDKRISKTLLVRLHNAGVNSATLSERIASEGIRFEMTRAIHDELVAAHFEPDLLKAIENALANRGHAAIAPPAATGVEEEELPREPQKILDLYRSGRIAEAFTAIRENLDRTPGNVWMECALGEAALGLHQEVDVRTAVGMLKHSGGDNATSCARGLEEALAETKKQSEIRFRILEQLTAGNEAGAHQSIDQSSFSPGQRMILHHYVDRTQASFANALAVLAGLPKEMPGMTAQIDVMRKEVKEEAASFQQLRSRAEKYLYSPVSTGACSPESARVVSAKSGYVLEEYLEVARILMERYPNYPMTRDVYLHALLLSAPYEEARRYGLDTLKRLGTLRIPFYSQTSPFWLVIDSDKRRIRIEKHAVYTTNMGNTEGLMRHDDFDLPFEAIIGVKQTFGLDLTVGRLAPKVEALRLAPAAVAPYPAFSHFLYCLYGEKAVREYMWKVGRFTADVLDLPESKVALPDPGKQSHDWINLLSQVASQVTIGAVNTMQNSSFTVSGGYSFGGPQTNFVLRQNLMEAANSLLQLSTQIAELHNVAADVQATDYRIFRNYLMDRAITVVDWPRRTARLDALEQLLKQ